MITITLNQIKKHNPCKDGWKKIVAAKGHLGYDTPWPLSDALDTNGLQDVLWALRCLPEYEELWRKFTVWCARQVQHLMTDQRSIDALDVAWRHSNGEATDAELYAAEATAWAAWAVWAAQGARALALAARAAALAAQGARVGARAAALGALDAARAALLAAPAAALGAQKDKLRAILDAGEWVEDEIAAAQEGM